MIRDNSADRSASQRQLLPHRLDSSFRISAVFTRPCATAWMVWDFDQWKFCYAKKLCFSARQLHENRLAQSDRRLSLFLQFNRVVDTPRGARASSTQTGDDRVTPIFDLLHNDFRRALHVGGFGFKDHLLDIKSLLNQFGQFLKHVGRVRLAIINDADRLALQ